MSARETMSWWATWWKTKAGYERKCAVLAEARVEELTAELARVTGERDTVGDSQRRLAKDTAKLHDAYKALEAELAEARRRLGLAEAWLKADEENVLITIEHGKVTDAREAFRDSLKGPV